MRALILLLVALLFLVPAVLLLQQPANRWSLLVHAAGLTLGGIALLLVLTSLAMALWGLIRDR